MRFQLSIFIDPLALGGHAVYQLRNTITLSACAVATAVLVSACGGGSASTASLMAQATLTAVAASTSLTTGGTTTLSTSGGSGTGAVTYAVASGASSCSIASTTLTASAAGSCTVTATKAADATYSAATSAAITVTVSAPLVASTTYATFDETPAPTLTNFGGLTGTIDTDPALSSNKALKLIKTAAGETWAGSTITTCATGTTGSVPTIPLTSTNKTMTLRAYAPAANTVFRLKLENSADGTKSVETDATVTTANTWQTLTFDFSANATGTPALNTSTVYNKASIFPNFGNKVDATYYVEDLKFIGVSGVSQTCPTPTLSTVSLPVTFDNSALTYSVVDFGGNASVVQAAPTGGTVNAVKVVKGAVGTSSETWAGTTVVTGTIPFTSSGKTMTVSVWAPTVGKMIRLKAEHLTDPTISVETEAATTVASGWQTLTFNFATQATGTAALNVASTYGKVSIFFDFNVPGTGQTYYFDTITFGAP